MEDETWIEAFHAVRGNELFVEIDVDFLSDRFNLTGLAVEGERIQDLLNVITDHVDAPPLLASMWPSSTLPPITVAGDGERSSLDSADSDMSIESTTLSYLSLRATKLYGLIHARYILSSRGLHKVMEKYSDGGFGRCPRALCRSHPLLPVGWSDAPGVQGVKLWCPKCEDAYHPAPPRQACIDGAYFGVSLPAMFFQMYPRHIPRHSEEQFVLKVFGFKLHEHSELARYQQAQRQEQEKRLESAGMKWY